MTAKQVLFRSAAREKVLRGATQLADAVRITLGPKSKSVLIQKKWGAPVVCNDGVTIAKEMELEDPEENLGAQMLRQAAEKTGDAVGDGTSTRRSSRMRFSPRGYATSRPAQARST
jgi:chaperonin GroEL